MTSIAEKFFVASLIYLLLGLFAQTIILFDVWLGFNPLAYTAMAATKQILLVGWLTQLALAIVYDRWLVLAPEREISDIQNLELQSSTPRPMLVFVLFNIGLPLTILGQPGLMMFGGWWLGAITAFGGLLQFFAGLVFVYDAWQRLRG